MSDTRDISPTEILAWMQASFSVDADRGILVWKEPPRVHPRMIGKEAGSLRSNHNGKLYCHVRHARRAFKRSWLIFLWVHRRWPTDCIDHIDGNSTNDAIGNLREATATQNAWNHKRRARRIALPMGVRLMGSGRYEARISYHKKQIHLGAFETPEAAHTAYVAKRKELYREYA